MPAILVIGRAARNAWVARITLRALGTKRGMVIWRTCESEPGPVMETGGCDCHDSGEGERSEAPRLIRSE